MKRIVQSYFDTLSLCGAAVLKVMDQKTLVKRADEVIRCL